MAAVVPEFPPEIDVLIDLGVTTSFDDNLARIATPVIGDDQWRRWNDAALWALAQGGTLVMQGPSGVITPDSSGTFRYYTWKHDQNVARVWCLTVSPVPATTLANWSAFGTVELPNGIPHVWRISPSDYGRATSFEFIETATPDGFDVGVLNFGFGNHADSIADVQVMGLCCYEIRRLELDTFGPSDYPVCAPHTLQTGAPIIEGGVGLPSIGGLYQIANDPDMLMREVRRPCLFSDFRPAGFAPGTSYEEWFAEPPPVIVSPRFAGQFQRTVAVAVYGHGPSGSSVRFTADSGDSVVVALPTSDGYAFGELDVDCEDDTRYDDDGGLQSGARDFITIEAIRVGGIAGDCIVYGVYIGDAGGL